MAPDHIIIRALIMLLRRPAITLLAMALRQVGTQSPTACSASGRTIQGAERISGQMAIVIRALDGAQGRNFPRYDDARRRGGIFGRLATVMGCAARAGAASMRGAARDV